MIAPVQTLSGFLEQVYLPERLTITDGAVEQLRIAVRLFGRFLGHDPLLTELSKPDLFRYLKEMLNSRSPATVNSRRAAILCLWRAAAGMDLCSDSPRCPPVKEPQSLPTAWTLEEVSRLLASCGTLRGDWHGLPVSLAWRLGLLVLWDTAWRIGTLLSARLGQVDLARGLVTVPAAHLKGRRADRLFQLHPQTMALITESMVWPREQLFPWPHQRRQIWVAFGRVLTQAGLPHDRKHKFHCIRRSAESYAAQARGVNFAAGCVGHSVQVAMQSYISPEICRQPSLIEALPRPELN